jgi:transposase
MVASGNMGNASQGAAIRSRRRRLHYRRFCHSSAPGRFGRKRGIKINALGHSRGGFSTKLHALVDTKGRPLHVELTPGQQHEATVAPLVVEDHAQGRAFIGDTGYDSNDIIAAVRKRGMKPVICAHPRRNKKPRLDRKTYKKRYLVEVYFHNIKRFRAVATRFEKNARHYLSLVQLVSSLLWIPESAPVLS